MHVAPRRRSVARGAALLAKPDRSGYDPNRMMTTSDRGRSRGVLLMVLVLCLCIVAQMLGVPVTLLSPADSPDQVGSSVLEGFSVPPPTVEFLLAGTSVKVSDRSSVMHVPVIASALFHPPVR